MVKPNAFIVVSSTEPPWRRARTERSLAAAASLRDALTAKAETDPLWLVQSGAWTSRDNVLVPTVLGALALIGATLNDDGLPNDLWQTWLQQTGGVATPDFPPPATRSVCLSPACFSIIERFDWSQPDDLVQQLHAHGVRVIRHASLDVGFDDRLRILEVITSLQRGGAERIALTVHEELIKLGVASTLCVLGSPTRATFATPQRCVSLRHRPYDPVSRAEDIDRVARRLGSDVIHAHLIEGETTSWLTGKGWPVLLTLHNERPGWQGGYDARLPTPPHLHLVSCSSKVTSDARAAMPGAQLRVAWNGIQPQAITRCRSEQPTLLLLANPRPQKRLALAAEAFACWRKTKPGKLILAGQPSAIHTSAAEELAAFWRVIDRHELRDSVSAPGAVEDVPALLATCDVLLSTSAHEGMSIAHLEAIDAGLRLVVTDVGGAAELSAAHASVVVVSKEVSPEAFAEAIDEALTRQPAPLARDFTAAAMTQRYHWLLRLLVSQARRKAPRGVLLITNNLSTGGAQSSARRLLLGLRSAGEHVRAATLQERPDQPTPGRSALIEAGIEVIATMPPESLDATIALQVLLDAANREPPEVVVFWNVMPDYKVLLAEAFQHARIFDVSPGEMFFDSFERYFARPRAGSPCRCVGDYAAMLSGVIVKHSQEAGKARQWFGLPVRVIANGVTILPQSPGTSHQGIVIGTAARLHPHKRLSDLIDAFRIVSQHRPKVILRIAGGEERGFESHAQELRDATAGLHVEWLGEVQDITLFHAGLDVFAMISEPIGCPNASLEAMAAGLPVVATAVGGAVDQMIDGESGVLVKPRDAGALAGALLRVIDDPALRQRLGMAARKRVEQCFSIEQMVTNYQAAFRSAT